MTLADREAEARRAFPFGAWRSSVGMYWRPHIDPTTAAIIPGGDYLPLEVPNSPCPDCEPPGSGLVEVGNPLDSTDPNTYREPCVECDGTGQVEADSILSRVRSGDPEWIAILDGVKR